MKTTFAAVSLSLAALATAQTTPIGGVSSLSSACQAAALGLVTSPFGQCANVGGLIGVLSASGSVIAPFNNFLRGACSQNCTPAVLNTASASVASGCSTDLASANPIATVLSTLVSPTGYGNVKGVVCLQATSNSTFCITNLLTSVQTSTGQDITVDTVTGLITGNTLVPLLNSLPAAQLCTDCSKGLVTNIKALVPANMTTSVNSAVSGKCGASFVDGRIPAGVSAFSSNSTGGPGAVTSTPLGAGESLRVEKTLTALALVAIAGWFL